MHHALLFSYLILNSINFIFSQNYLTEIKMIEQKVNVINSSLSQLKIIEIQKDSLGFKKNYFNDTIQKIEICSLETIHVEKRVAWFYYNKCPIYIEKNWTDLKSFKVIDNEKMYIKNKEIILWLDFNKKPVDLNSSENKAVCDMIVEYSKKIILNLK